MKIIITGATGSLGAYLVRYFAEKGHEIISTGRMANPPSALLARSTYIQADISKPFSLPLADACIHTAAVSDDKATPEQLYPANVTGTANVAEATAGCPLFVHVSSSSVYVPIDSPIPESMAGRQNTRNLSAYGYSKLLSENALHELSRHNTCFVLRPRVLYGPYDKVILPRMLRTVKNGILYKPGTMEVSVSMTHYLNFAHAVECCLLSELKGLHIYNITDEMPYLLIDVMRKMMRGLYGRQLPEKQIPVAALRIMAFLKVGNITPLFIRNLTSNAVLDISKARQEINYAPVTDFDCSLPELLDWVRQVGGVEAILSEAKELAWSG